MDQGFAASVLDAVPLPMVLIGADARLAFANPPGLALMGAEMLGRHHTIAMRQPALVTAIEAAMAQGRATLVPQVAFGGIHATHYRATVSPVGLAEGPGVICAFEDVTEQEQIGQIRRDFVANVSHELRTPLTALIGLHRNPAGPGARRCRGARAVPGGSWSARPSG